VDQVVVDGDLHQVRARGLLSDGPHPLPKYVQKRTRAFDVGGGTGGDDVELTAGGKMRSAEDGRRHVSDSCAAVDGIEGARGVQTHRRHIDVGCADVGPQHVVGEHTESCAVVGEHGERDTGLQRLFGGGNVSGETFIEILTDAAYTGSAYGGYGPMIATRTYGPVGFSVALGLKDLGLAEQAAADTGTALPTSPALRSLFESAMDDDRLSTLDWSAVAEITRAL
jgi:hypothetical protein